MTSQQTSLMRNFRAVSVKLIDNMAGSSEHVSCFECGDTLLLKNLKQHYLRSLRYKGVKYKSTTSKNISDFVKKGRFGVNITGGEINCIPLSPSDSVPMSQKKVISLFTPAPKGGLQKDFRL